MEPLAKRSLHHLAGWLKDPSVWPTLDINQPPPGYRVFLDPSFPQVLSFLTTLPPEGVALDIEGNAPYIRCIGLTRMSDLTHLCVWLLRQGGIPAWTPAETEIVFDTLRTWVPQVPLWMHNGQAFDYGELCAEPLLWDPALTATAYAAGGDTMLLQRHAYAEQPAGLQHMTISYLRWTAWKHLTTEDEEDEGKA